MLTNDLPSIETFSSGSALSKLRTPSIPVPVATVKVISNLSPISKASGPVSSTPLTLDITWQGRERERDLIGQF